VVGDNSIAECKNDIEIVTRCPRGSRAVYVDGDAICVPVDSLS